MGLIDEAYELWDDDCFKEALEKLEEAYKITPDRSILTDMGMIYENMGDYSKAIEIFDKLLEEDSNYAQAYYGLGLVYEDLEECEKALSYYNECLFYDPNHQGAHFFIANLYDDLKNQAKAIYHYECVLKSNPNSFWSYVNLAHIYEQKHELNKSFELLLKAYDINPENEVLLYNMGVVCNGLGDTENAIKFYLEAIKNPNCYQYTYLNLGQSSGNPRLFNFRDESK